MDKIINGAESTAYTKADSSNTALSMGSGSLEVFATPAVIALMEKAACQAIADMLDEGTTTVGTLISVEHLSASPVGSDISARAVLTAVDGRKYCFDVFAYDNAGLIAKGKHERFSVSTEKFMNKATQKLN
ncbi:MAG: thioesterase family protein [Clostridia bacterium]|nr:thioesterase family protein [Clostridia bacterium]